MKKTLLFTATLGLLCCSVSYASHTEEYKGGLRGSDTPPHLVDKALQNTIQGTVSDNSGPLAGATVQVVGTSVATATDGTGRYTITVPDGALLRFSMVGYKTHDVRATRSTIDVTLSHDEHSLEQVVVVGYGTQRRSNLTGAVTSVDADEVFHNRPIADPARGLQGAVPGLNIVVPTGEVGSDPILRIRGQVGSVLGGAAPLVLVDNVEVPSLQYVNTNDIETVTVLKDAASTSIYGAKAAFGVVLITTKKGSRSEGAEVTYSNNFITQSPFENIEVAGIEGLQYTQDAHDNMQQAGPAGGFWRIDLDGTRDWLEKYGNTVKPGDPVVYGRDWYWDGTQKFGKRIYDPVGMMIRDNAFSQIHNLSVNGRAGNTTYNLGLGYLGQQGMMKAARRDDYMRLNPSVRVSTKVNDFLTVRGGALYTEAKKHFPTSLNEAGYAADPWVYLYRWSRLFPIGVQEHGEDMIDPAFSAASAPSAVKHDRFINLNVGTTIDITDNWTFVGDYSYNAENTFNSSAVPYVRGRSHWYGTDPLRDEEGIQIWADGDGNRVFPDDNGNYPEGATAARQFPMADHTEPDKTYVSRGSYMDKRHTINAFSTYNLRLDEAHDFEFTAGANIVSYEWLNHSSRIGSYLVNPDNPQFQWARGERTVSGGNNWESQAVFFGRFNYAFRDKYLFNANLTRNGSSKFPPHLKWQWFPSVSGGWVLSNEDFMESLNPVLNFAKFRASWGSIGDQTVPNNLYIPTMGTSQNSWVGSGDRFYQLGTPGQVLPDIAWQRIEHTNIGADFRFFNNALGLTAEWYQRYTKDMLMPGETVAATLGTGVPVGNYGDLRTRGFEINMDYSYQFDNGLALSLNANLSDAVTTITKGTDWNLAWENRSLSTTFSTGRRYGDVFGYVTDRLYQQDDFVYDANGDFVKTTIVRNGTARDVHVLAGDNPVYQHFFHDGGEVMMISPGDVKFKDLNGDGYIDEGTNTNGNPGDRTVIGNITPRYEYGFRLGADYKGFNVSVFLQGIGQRSIWGSGQLATPGYHVRDGAMPLAIATDYWREDRTDAFYPRAWHMGGSNSGWVMRPQSRYMLDMSYLRVKNITVGYNIPGQMLSRFKMKNARIYVSLENMFTFDNLRGLPIDPEAISGVSSLVTGQNYNLGRTGTSNPTFKSASAGVQIGF